MKCNVLDKDKFYLLWATFQCWKLLLSSEIWKIRAHDTSTRLQEVWARCLCILFCFWDIDRMIRRFWGNLVGRGWWKGSVLVLHVWGGATAVLYPGWVDWYSYMKMNILIWNKKEPRCGDIHLFPPNSQKRRIRRPMSQNRNMQGTSFKLTEVLWSLLSGSGRRQHIPRSRNVDQSKISFITLVLERW